MPTVTVTDVVVRSRRVRLAMTCPNCSSNLGLEGALHVRGFVGEVKIGRLARTKARLPRARSASARNWRCAIGPQPSSTKYALPLGMSASIARRHASAQSVA